jgi:phosphohistidine phosphatase
MHLCLIRHGDAVSDGEDAQRALSPEGCKQIHELALALGALGMKPRAILSSPLLRARQTAAILQEALAPDIPVEPCELLLPATPKEQIIHHLRERAAEETVFLVGHLPHLGELLTLLIWGQPEREVAISKAGACLIEFDGTPRMGKGRLRWLLSNTITRIIAATSRA